MGYAKQGQNTKGIHIRQYSRAFVFEEEGHRNVFVSVDIGMMGQLIKMEASTQILRLMVQIKQLLRSIGD